MSRDGAATGADLERWARALAQEHDPALALRIRGGDPILHSDFRVGEAAAAALSASSLAAARLWCERGGAPQRVEVDVDLAAASLLSFVLQTIPGVSLARDLNRPTIALYRTRDERWIHLHGGFPALRDGILTLLACRDGADSIAGAVSRWGALELEDALAERGLCGAVLRSHDEWHAHPQGAQLATTPLVEIQRIGDAEPEKQPPAGATGLAARPLAGVRVLDLTRVLAGPTCGRTLAEHGADVLHVRSPHLPSIEPFVVDTNPGKRSCHLDLDRTDDAACLGERVREADVFCQGYRSGSLARRGWSAEEVSALRPGVVYVSINCYGHEGPWSARAGWEQLAQTATGMGLEHGGHERPAIVPAAVTDYTTGTLAALGAMSALLRRAREGGSWHVRVSLARTAMWIASLPRGDGSRATGLDPARLAGARVELDTPWGRLSRLAPVTRMSLTPPRWERPPVPLGSDPPRFASAPGHRP